MRSKSGPGGTLYQYGLCELAQRQAVLVRKYKSSSRAIKSDRAKVVMTAGCISRNFGIRKTAIDEIFNDCRSCIVDKTIVRYYLSIFI